jgi:DNA-binding NtrC family response regulator
VREFLISQLQQCGYKVSSADSSDQAIELIANNESIKLLLSDISIPGTMDGYQLVKTISENHPNVRVMVSSGNFDPAHMSSLVDKEYFEFINKPYQIKILIHKVANMLDGVVHINSRLLK